jgi:hypothetical protein
MALSQNLYDSSGTIIWDATANSVYNNNVSLIGRDDAISLNQKQITTSIPKVGLGTIAASNAANTYTFATDKSYLVWGDNAGTMSDSGTDVTITFSGGTGVTSYVDIPNKKWKIVETGGDVATTKVSIATSAFSSLPALSGNDAYVMIVASDASFTSNVETVFLTTSGANQLGDYDFDGTKYFTFGVTHQNTYSRHLTLNGSNNVVKFEAVNNLTAAFTMMFWVRPNGQNTLSNNRTIAAKYNGTTGYRVYLSTDNKINVTWSGGTALVSSTALPDTKWHNVAIVYSTGSIKLYIDGVLDSTVSSSAPATNTHPFAIGAEYRSKSDIQNYFKGDIDEFRLWNKAVTLSQMKYIINQEIVQNGIETNGTIIPASIAKNDVKSLRWSNLVAYYSMNSFIGTHINDDSSSNNRGCLFSHNQVTVTTQSAPMPYQTAASGSWTSAATWSNGSLQDAPNSNSIVDNTTPIDWNIVKTSHDVSSASNKTLQALFVVSNGLSATNDTKIEVSHYLKLDGKIDLVGKSQLVQPDSSELDESSSGYIERDQQGQANKFNYNYWSSPVSSINSVSLNHGFTVADVMKDGTTTTPLNLNWTVGINGVPTAPITLSSYWIFKFQEIGSGVANWSSVGQNGTLLSGYGFTMKGCGIATPTQNYTFVGKPNNGTIDLTVSANNLNLCGNPYPSAIDANQFIDDNVSSITGTLYFWEHYSTNTSHNTVEYQGGYATYTKTGGTAPVAPSYVSGLGSSSKVAQRFVPVGQGFFVTGSATGGNITFNNNQRIFIKEDNAQSYSLYKANPISGVNSESNANEDSFIETPFTKISLGFDSANNYHRQILIGFMNQFATSGIDKGYDGMSIEFLSNDMYFINNGIRLNIQGEGYFNVNNIYPLGVKNAVAGIVKFGIDIKENLDENQDVFIYDNVTNQYHNIKSQSFEINLPAGTHNDRFSLRFIAPSALGTVQNELQNGISVVYSQSNSMINIKNELNESNIESVALYNLIGQNITDWKLDSQNQSNIQLPVSGLSAGSYIVKVNTDKGSISKKFIVN